MVSSSISFYSEVKWIEVAQSCPTLCDPMDCSLPCSSVRGILRARILEWVAISFSRRSSQPRDWTWVSHILGRCFTIWASREVLWTSDSNVPRLRPSFEFLVDGFCRSLLKVSFFNWWVSFQWIHYIFSRIPLAQLFLTCLDPTYAVKLRV